MTGAVAIIVDPMQTARITDVTGRKAAMSDIESWLDTTWSTLERPWVHTWFSGRTHPEQIYHYGRAEGLLSILASQCFWATEAHYLNDASELHYSNGIVRETVGTMTTGAASAAVRRFLAGLLPSTSEIGGRAVYTVSFSEDGDILSQWRAYAGTTGYAIGLATQWWDLPEAPGESLGRWPGPLRLRKVVYAEEEQRQMIQSLLEPACMTLAQAAEEFGEARTIEVCEPRLRQHVTDYLHLLSPCLKHPAFGEEREWRVIYMPDTPHRPVEVAASEVRFRSSAIGLVPYVTLPLPAKGGPYQGRLPVTEVYHGPSENPDLTASALSLLLEQHGYVTPHTVVKGSRAPLRV
jgi:hypothetical protein